MKALTLLTTVLVSLALPGTFQQGALKEVVILKFSWNKERIRMRPSVSSLASQDELIQQARRQRQLAAARNAADQGTASRLETQIINHEDAKAKATQSAPSDFGYKYRVTVRNDGTKTVKSIDWDYIFLDPTTQHEVARHQFTSDETIKPAKIKEISVLYSSAPVRTISAKMLAGKEPLPYTEQVAIARILYVDGSVWSP